MTSAPETKTRNQGGASVGPPSATGSLLRRLRRWARPILGGLALAAAGSAAWWWLARGPIVVVASVTRGDAAEIVYATGVVEPRSWAKVTALVRKRIVDLCHCEGRAVKKGDVLARLDDVEEKAVLTELSARRERLADDVSRLKTLVERNVSSRVAYEDKVTQLKEYDARLSAQRDRILDLELRAPMDGIVLRRDGEVGEIAGTSVSDVLFWIGQPKPLRIVAEVNEEDIAKVMRGQTVLLRHDGFTAGGLKAKVDEITPKGDPATKTFRVYLALPDDTPLRIGMSIEANIVVREVKGTLLVPADAVRAGTSMIVKDGRAWRRVVETGIKGSRLVEVRAGLGEAEQVISPARADLADGARVRLQPGARP